MIIGYFSPTDRIMADTNTNSAGNTFSLSEAHQYLEFWREFDLDGRRLSLDKTCAEMKDMKSASIAARKRLNETTKTFRAKSKDEQVLPIFIGINPPIYPCIYFRSLLWAMFCTNIKVK